jgi:hypothetical protein
MHGGISPRSFDCNKNAAIPAKNTKLPSKVHGFDITGRTSFITTTTLVALKFYTGDLRSLADEF